MIGGVVDGENCKHLCETTCIHTVPLVAVFCSILADKEVCLNEIAVLKMSMSQVSSLVTTKILMYLITFNLKFY